MTSSRFAQERLEIPHGSIRATCLIETTPAAFEMEEILYELRRPFGRAQRRPLGLHLLDDQELRRLRDHLLPDRSQVTMTSPFMAAYAELLVKTCHARGAHAIGGMAAFVPSKADPDATAAALEKTIGRTSPARPAAGFDGSWVAHPALVPTCTEAFHRGPRRPADQLDKQRDGRMDHRLELTDVSSTGGGSRWTGMRTTSGSAWNTSRPGWAARGRLPFTA